MGNLLSCGKTIRLYNSTQWVDLQARSSSLSDNKVIWTGVMYPETKKVIVKESRDLHYNFVQEVTSLRMLTHPNIVTLYGFAAQKARTYVVMECIEGKDLFEIIKAQEPIQLESVFSQIIHALYYMQKTFCMSHGDISPENVMICGDRTAKLIDFEESRVDEIDITIKHPYGKRKYMAPEVFQMSNPIDVFAADIWSLGATMMFCKLQVGKTLMKTKPDERPALSELLDVFECTEDLVPERESL